MGLVRWAREVIGPESGIIGRMNKALLTTGERENNDSWL